MIQDSNPGREQEIFYFSKISTLAVGPNQPTIQEIPGFFRGVEWPGHEVNHKPPSSAKVKNEYSYTSTPPFAFMTWKGTTLPLIKSAYQYMHYKVLLLLLTYEGWNFNSGNYLFTTDTK